jgi:hypothetical protein
LFCSFLKDTAGEAITKIEDGFSSFFFAEIDVENTLIAMGD